MDISKYISNFIHELSNTKITKSSLNIRIEQLINDIAPILNIGRFSMQINELGKVYDLDLEGNLIEYNGNYDNEYIEKDFTIKPAGNINIKCYPEQNYKFTDLDMNRLEMILTMISTVYRDILYSGYIDQSYLYDSTTGTLNPSGLIESGVILSKRGKLKNYATLFFNIQSFKLLNMRFGMKKTNLLLRMYSDSINNLLDEEEFLARAGGDNFIAIVKKEHVYDFARSSGSIILNFKVDTISEVVLLKNRIGVFPIGESDSIIDAIQNSSIAMNIAKDTRTDLMYFDSHMKDNIIKEKEVMNLFSDAIRAKEFIVFYQPKVNLNDNSLCGSEALIRWHREGKFIPPNDFIPILEKEKSICKLDFYVLKTVCEDIIEFLDNGIDPVKVSINFSKQNLRDPAFPKKIIEILKIFGIDPKYIEIELTETTNPTDYNSMIEFVDEMKKNDISVSIDDFGTGYSSVSTVKDLNVETVKIDKAFIDQLDKEKDRIVLKNMIRMIKELKMDVIAEGVETENQIEILKTMGCEKVQGYYFDKPLEKKEYTKRLTNKKYSDR